MDAELCGRVKAVIAREWNVPVAEVPDDAALNRTPRWDSLGHITLLLALQGEFGLEVTADTVQELVSLPRIVEKMSSVPA